MGWFDRRLVLSSRALVLGLALGAPFSSAEGMVTFETAWSKALQNNPSLNVSSWAQRISEGEKLQASARPNPELSWETEDTRSDTSTTTIQVSQMLELGGKREARINLAERGLEMASVREDQARNELRAEVVRVFYGVLKEKMQVELAEDSERISKNNVQVVEILAEAGKASLLDLSRAQLLHQDVSLDARRAADAYDAALNQLRLIMGERGAGELVPSGRLSDIPGAPNGGVLLQRLDGVAEMRLARIEIERQEAGLQLEKSQRVPDLTVSLGSQYSRESRERVNVLGLSMPIPLFDRNQGGLLAAARRADRARDLRNATELRLQGEVQQALTQWRTAADAVVVFERDLLGAADASMQRTTRGFEMGKFAFIDVLDAQRALVLVRSSYLRSLSESIDAWARIERIYGDLGASSD